MAVSTVTVMLQQRLTPAWLEADTLALPEAFFDEILNYSEREREGWKVAEAEILDEGETPMLASSDG